jgi:glycerophosphoryl diester phosphodiesterase
MQRIAHRGGAHLAPENTVAAFQHALTLPVDAVELDIQMSRDGHLIVFHDHTVERLTNGKGNILDLDFAYLRSLNAAAHFPGGWSNVERIPTLGEVLEQVRGYVRVFIEIKTSHQNGIYGRYPQIVEAMVDEIRRLRMQDQVTVISFDWSILPEVKALEATLQTGAIVSQEVWSPQGDRALEALCTQVKTLQCDWLNISYKLFTAAMPTIAHAHRLQLGLWTVNSLQELRLFATTGVDALTTDRPDLFTCL